MLCKRWRNTNDELVSGSFIFVPGFRDKKYQSKTKRGQSFKVSNAEMDWNNEKNCHWLTTVGLGEFVQVFRGMFVKLGITGKESSFFFGLIMKSKTPEKFEKLLPNDYWLLVPWRFYAWHPHHTSRDRSRFLRMILFINNTKNTFYETKVLKTKHVLFLKYICNALLISYRTFGPVSLRNLPVQHEIYQSRSVRPVPISTAVSKIHKSWLRWLFLYNNTSSKAIVNAASNITYRPLIEADDTGR